MSGRRLFGDRSRNGQVAAFVGVAVGAAILGYTAGSLGKQVLATQLARAERGNLELRENNTALESALRNARVPLQRRIHELEVALGGTPRALGGKPAAALAAAPALAEAAPALAEPEAASETASAAGPEPEATAVAGAAAAALAAPQIPPEAAARLAELETAREQQQAERTRLEGEVAGLSESLSAEEGLREDLEAENRRLAKRITELELARSAAAESAEAPLAPVGLAASEILPALPALPARPAPAAQTKPAVPAAPDPAPEPSPAPVAAPPAALPAAPAPEARAPAEEQSARPAAPSATAPACAALEKPEFRLEAAGEAIRRLDGRLVMRLARTGDGLALELGADGERYPLESTPQHVSFDCGGTPYIVSVCQVEAASEATGTIWLADTWRNPCR